MKWRGGRKRKETGKKTVKTRCLKSTCEKEFMTGLDRCGRKLEHICPRCRFINSFLGDNETECALRFG